jgi:glutaminase
VQLKDGSTINPSTNIGKMRLALLVSGYGAKESYRFFTQVRKDRTRRVKFWLSDDVFFSAQEKQEALEYALKHLYGQNYVGGYFMKNPPEVYHSSSFCVILKA